MLLIPVPGQKAYMFALRGGRVLSITICYRNAFEAHVDAPFKTWGTQGGKGNKNKQ